MELSLAPEIVRLIRDRVDSGHYGSAEDVVIAAIAALDRQERVAEFDAGELDRLLAEGDADIERGDVLDGDEAFERRRARRRAQAQAKAG